MPRDLDQPPMMVDPPEERRIFGSGGIIEQRTNDVRFAPQINRLNSIAMTIRTLTYDEMMEWDAKLREMMGQPDGPEGIYAALFSRWAKERTMAGLAEGMKEFKGDVLEALPAQSSALVS